MTGKQPYTPTTEKVRGRYATAVYEFSVGGAVPDPDPEFDRWYQAEIAAAEERGAEEGWDLAIDHAWDDSSIYEADAKRAKAANPYRACGLEGDDD